MKKLTTSIILASTFVFGAANAADMKESAYPFAPIDNQPSVERVDPTFKSDSSYASGFTYGDKSRADVTQELVQYNAQHPNQFISY